MKEIGEEGLAKVARWNWGVKSWLGPEDRSFGGERHGLVAYSNEGC